MGAAQPIRFPEPLKNAIEAEIERSSYAWIDLPLVRWCGNLPLKLSRQEKRSAANADHKDKFAHESGAIHAYAKRTDHEPGEPDGGAGDRQGIKPDGALAGA